MQVNNYGICLPYNLAIYFIVSQSVSLAGDIAGGLDGRDVLCTGRTLILELDLLRHAHCGKHRTNTSCKVLSI
jgi:hypothetical protein